MKLAGQAVVVTGGGRGIGRAIAEACAREGARVTITARTESELRETAALIRERGGQVDSEVSDVTDEEAVLRTAQNAYNRWGRIDLLVNNAGSLTAVGPSWEVDPKAWFEDIRTNLLGTHLWCRAVIPRMIEQKAGRIVNLLGGGVYGAYEYGSGYGTSKAGVMRYTETLAQELAGTRVAVFALDPGLVRTQMAESLVSTPERRQWFHWIKTGFDEGKDVPAREAAGVVVELATGRLDKLSGRAVYHQDEAAKLEREIPEILAGDLRSLRVTGSGII